MKLYTAVLFFCLAVSAAYSNDWKFSGQVQIRTELDGRDFSHDTYPLTFTNMRARLGVERILTNDISAFIQFQDSRVFGETKNTIASLKNTDLHQGYLMFRNIFAHPIHSQVGRFEFSYRDGKVFGTNQHNYIARAWDGLKFMYETKPFSLDLFALTHNNAFSYIGGATPNSTNYTLPAKPETGFNVWGFWSKTTFDKEHYLDFFGFYEWNRQRTTNQNYEIDRYNVGTHYKFTYENFSTLLEGVYQGGFAGDRLSSKQPKKVQAYMLNAAVNYKISDLLLGLFADINSGTSTKDITEGKMTNSYIGAYQSKHIFYGSMDYFSNIPLATNNRGLNDIYLRLDYRPNNADLLVRLEAHHFATNKAYRLQDGGNDTNLGQEIDVILRYNILKGSTIEWGGSLFLPGNTMKDIWDYDKTDGAGNYDRTDPAFWSYIMLRVNL